MDQYSEEEQNEPLKEYGDRLDSIVTTTSTTLFPREMIKRNDFKHSPSTEMIELWRDSIKSSGTPERILDHSMSPSTFPMSSSFLYPSSRYTIGNMTTNPIDAPDDVESANERRRRPNSSDRSTISGTNIDSYTVTNQNSETIIDDNANAKTKTSRNEHANSDDLQSLEEEKGDQQTSLGEISRQSASGDVEN